MSTPSIAEDAPRYAGEEWATRVEPAALYRIADRYGMSDIANQEIGARGAALLRKLERECPDYRT